MEYQIIQNEILKQDFLTEEEQRKMKKEELFRRLEEWMLRKNITGNVEIKNEIKTICEVLVKKYRIMKEFNFKETKTTDSIFIKLFDEYKDNGFAKLDKFIKKRKLKYVMNKRVGRFNKNIIMNNFLKSYAN